MRGVKCGGGLSVAGELSAVGGEGELRTVVRIVTNASAKIATRTVTNCIFERYNSF